MMQASQRRDQRRRRDRRRPTRIALLKEAGSDLSPTSLFNTATAQPPRPGEERHGRRVPRPTLTEPTWRAGDKVHWQGYIGFFLQDDDDGYAQMLIGTRTYRVRKAELRSA